MIPDPEMKHLMDLQCEAFNRTDNEQERAEIFQKIQALQEKRCRNDY